MKHELSTRIIKTQVKDIILIMGTIKIKLLRLSSLI